MCTVLYTHHCGVVDKTLYLSLTYDPRCTGYILLILILPAQLLCSRIHLALSMAGRLAAGAPIIIVLPCCSLRHSLLVVVAGRGALKTMRAAPQPRLRRRGAFRPGVAVTLTRLPSRGAVRRRCALYCTHIIVVSSIRCCTSHSPMTHDALGTPCSS